MKKISRKNVIIIAISLMIVLIIVILLFVKNIIIVNKVEEKSIKNGGKVEYTVKDNKAIYEEDEDGVRKIYITVAKDNKKNMGNLYRYRFHNFLTQKGKPETKPKLNVQVEFDKPSPIMAGSDVNATIEPKGHATSRAAQKSYKIKLSKKAGKWKGQSVINLNKCPYDLTRIRAKLAFDLIKTIPDIFSMRTEFFQVYVKDLAGGSNEFVDQGLYTQIEQPNESYIKNHGLAQEGYLYKAEFFEFNRYADRIKNVTDPAYDKVEFNKILKCRGIEDHTRLIKMLDDVNNYDLNIDDVINKHFNRENYLTWLAINILTGNRDTTSQNFLLFSPVTSDKWYFIPWDYDGAFGFECQGDQKVEFAPWQMEPLSNYWGVKLHKRFLSNPKNLKDLTQKVEEISKYMSKDKIESLVSKYYNETNAIIKSQPDIQFLPSTEENYEKEIKRLPFIVEENKKKFYDSMNTPMPIFLGEPKVEGNEYRFNWDESFDFKGNNLTYNFTISKDPSFNNIVFKKDSIKSTFINVPNLEGGKYYWKVEICDSNGRKQVAFDSCYDGDAKYYGVKELEVK